MNPPNDSDCRQGKPRSSVLWLLALLSLLRVHSLPAAEDFGRFELNELFGVSHPDQVVTFDLVRPVDPQRTVLVADDGSEVPYQLVDGGKQLAVHTRLAAGTHKTFALRPGIPTAKVAGAVTVKETADVYEIANGLTGIRIAKAVNIADTQQVPAPIQGLLLRDGKWYGCGSNRLDYQSAADRAEKTVATGMTVRLLERGPLTTVVQIDYRFEHPNLMYGQTVLKPAGKGYYTSTITLQAGQPSLLFEEDTDFEPRWSIEQRR